MTEKIDTAIHTANRGINILFDYGGLIVALLLFIAFLIVCLRVLFTRNQKMADDTVKTLTDSAAQHALFTKSIEANTAEVRRLTEATHANTCRYG